MKELFSRSHQIGSYLIRLKTWSPWSHCAILTPTGTVIESIFPHGTREVDYESWRKGKTAIGFKERKVANVDAALRFARQQLGKEYDTLGVIGIALNRRWDSDSRWYCSELNECILAAGGLETFDPDTTNFISPENRWMVK